MMTLLPNLSIVIALIIICSLRAYSIVGALQNMNTHAWKSMIRPAMKTTRLFATESGRASAAVVQGSKKGNGVEISLAPPKGTRDFYPEEHRLKTWLFTRWRDIAAQYGFEEYDAPVVESEELYIRKAGEEITGQLYNFADKGGRRLSLRPEMTPSLARMVLSKGKSLSFPLKWYSIPQCWRYERMTKGRRREHYQWNMDVWGVTGVEAEAELLAALVTTFESMGLTAKDVGIKVNSRKILNALMESVGIPEEKWVATCVLVDKLEKVPVSALSEDLAALGLKEDVVQNLLDSLKIRDIQGFVTKLGADSPGVADILYLMDLLDGYGITEWIQFDASVVRGLAYYTGTVFEGFDRSGELRAICGGGRYDSLLQSLGAADAVPAVGFGFGDAVIVELLKSKNLLPDLETSGRGQVDVIVYAMDPTLRKKAANIAAQLRSAAASSSSSSNNNNNHPLRVDLVMDKRKPKWVFARADRLLANAVVMLASDEDARGEVTLKDIKNREQAGVSYDTVVDKVQEIMSATQ